MYLYVVRVQNTLGLRVFGLPNPFQYILEYLLQRYRWYRQRYRWNEANLPFLVKLSILITLTDYVTPRLLNHSTLPIYDLHTPDVFLQYAPEKWMMIGMQLSNWGQVPFQDAMFIKLPGRAPMEPKYLAFGFGDYRPQPLILWRSAIGAL